MKIEYYTLGSRDEPEGLTLMTRAVAEDGVGHITMGDPAGWYKAKRISESEFNALKNEQRKTKYLSPVNGLLTPEQAEKNAKERRALKVSKWKMLNAGKIDLAKRLAVVLGDNPGDVLRAQDRFAPDEVVQDLRRGKL